MFEAIHSFLDTVTSNIQPTNPAGMAITYVVAFLVEIGIPIPFVIETLLFFASSNLGPLSLQVMSIAAMSLVGRETGAALLYWISRAVGQRFLDWVTRFFPRIEKRSERLKQRLQGNIVFAVATVRLTPGLLQVPSVVGGTIQIDYQRFVWGVALSSLLYDFLMVGLGFASKLGLEGVRSDLRFYIIILILVVLFIMWGIFFFILQRRNSPPPSA